MPDFYEPLDNATTRTIPDKDYDLVDRLWHARRLKGNYLKMLEDKNTPFKRLQRLPHDIIAITKVIDNLKKQGVRNG